MATPLLLHIMLHRTVGWSVRKLPDANGDECLQFCMPCEINGLQLRAKRKDSMIEPDGSNVSVVGWDFKCTPTFHCGNKLYALLCQIPINIYKSLVEKGKINCAEKKNIHGIMGDIFPWPYGTGYKKKEQ